MAANFAANEDIYDNLSGVRESTIQYPPPSRPLVTDTNLYDSLSSIQGSSSLTGDDNDLYDNVSRDYNDHQHLESSGFYEEVVSSPYYNYKMNIKLKQNVKKLDSILENLAELVDEPLGWNEYHSGQFDKPQHCSSAMLKRSLTFPVERGEIIYESIDDTFVNNTGTVKKCREVPARRNGGYGPDRDIDAHDAEGSTRTKSTLAISSQIQRPRHDYHADNSSNQYSGRNMFFHSQKHALSPKHPINVDILQDVLQSISDEDNKGQKVTTSHSSSHLRSEMVGHYDFVHIDTAKSADYVCISDNEETDHSSASNVISSATDYEKKLLKKQLEESSVAVSEIYVACL